MGNPRLRRLYDRGLISDEQPDASVHYPTEPGSGSTGFTESDVQRIKTSVKTFDQWTQDHMSETFSRTQYNRSNQDKKNRAKVMHSSTGNENTILLVIFGLILVLICCTPEIKNSDRKKS